MSFLFSFDSIIARELNSTNKLIETLTEQCSFIALQKIIMFVQGREFFRYCNVHKEVCVSSSLAFKVIKAYFSMLVFFDSFFLLSLIHGHRSSEKERKQKGGLILSFSYFLLQAAESVCLC